MEESGLPEIVPLICTSALWARVQFSHPEFPQRALLWGRLQQLTARWGGGEAPCLLIPSGLTIRVAVT